MQKQLFCFKVRRLHISDYNRNTMVDFLKRLPNGTPDGVMICADSAACCMQDNRIAVTFQYEYHDDNGQWFRAYGNEVCYSCPPMYYMLSGKSSAHTIASRQMARQDAEHVLPVAAELGLQ